MGRARRVLSSLFGAGAPRGPVHASTRACTRFALFAWLLDAAWTLRASGVPGAAPARGLLAGLGLALLLGLAAGVALGGLRALAALPLSGDEPVAWRTRVWRWLWQGDPGAQQQQRVGALLGLGPPLLLFAGLAFVLTRRIVIGMVRPHFAAITIVAAQLLCVALALALYPAARNAGILFARAAGRYPGVRWPFASAGRVLVLGAALAFAAVALLLLLYWDTLSFLPWRNLAVLALAAALTAIVLVLAARFSVFRQLERVLFASVLVAAVGTLVTLDPHAEVAKQAVYGTLAGRVGYAAAAFALDFDRDGYLGMFGGGDCGPFDARVNPAAMDIPNDGIDQDCDGVDLNDKQMGLHVRRDWPVPAAFPLRPSVVLITIDTFAAGHMQALGYARTVTPELDAFAKRSSFFRYCFSQGPSTRLSFPSLFTSRWDSQIRKRLVGGHPFPIEDSELLLAEYLHGAGYETVAVLPNAYFSRSHWGSLTAGFERVVESPITAPGRHNSAAVTDAALTVLRKPRRRPLFLWVHYYDAHSPHEQPEGVPSFGHQLRDLYDAELRLVDREVGRLLAGIEAEPGRQPLLFVTGDHGIAFEAPRHTKLNYGYDLTTVVLHVPLIVHGPAVRVQRRDQIVSTMDIAPTIVNLLRLPVPKTFEGASLLPELLQGRSSRQDRLLHEFFLEERRWENTDPLEQISLRSDRYNLIRDRKRGTFELYDWRKDYYETRNLADDPARRQVLVSMKQQLALLTYELDEDERKLAAAPRRLLPP